MGIARNIAPQFGVQVANVTVGTGVIIPTGANVGYRSQKENFPDGAGETVGQYFWNHMLEATIEVYPAGSTAAAANSAALLTGGVGQLLQPGKAITIVASNDSDLNSSWIINESSKTKSTTGRTTMTLAIERFITHGTNIAANEITV